ncbi:MAG: transaldolase family protein, partial [Rhodospirillales bacterium]
MAGYHDLSFGLGQNGHQLIQHLGKLIVEIAGTRRKGDFARETQDDFVARPFNLNAGTSDFLADQVLERALQFLQPLFATFRSLSLHLFVGGIGQFDGHGRRRRAGRVHIGRCGTADRAFQLNDARQLILARDTEGSISEARRLWNKVGRENLLIKIPATP